MREEVVGKSGEGVLPNEPILLLLGTRVPPLVGEAMEGDGDSVRETQGEGVGAKGVFVGGGVNVPEGGEERVAVGVAAKGGEGEAKEGEEEWEERRYPSEGETPPL